MVDLCSSPGHGPNIAAVHLLNELYSLYTPPQIGLLPAFAHKISAALQHSSLVQTGPAQSVEALAVR